MRDRYPQDASIAPARDLASEYVRSLMRSQLRLGIRCAVGFAIALLTIPLGISFAPHLHEVVLAGVPLPWLLLGFAAHPLVFATALLYSRAAVRNERRYRSLTSEPSSEAQ